ncbi:invasion protein CiaB [Helicobacter mustelae]|uniref:protein-tyrosine-phosphatase n=1 Tax=Helicobacter mustelae (strain ATCC 43772 / CCUG 25715 / CIP 103759 / LMG 18044 / NCTC 12198 / R85-136P) TaxID=679897 RepID=D3UHI6_HELM1|nr:invasion protein CiaB [Helicobacter mustelae]CBG39958.1 CiaB protein [Helicobacter mustelae 12198]SQH71470.1 CiaB protein [Helicobacter mustelae]
MAKKILFVCLGNICRSPLAEGMAREYVRQRGLDWEIDSAGTSGYHSGEPPHVYSIQVAAEYGIDISNLRSAKITPYTRADLFIVMDDSNAQDLISMGIPKHKVCKMGDFGLGGMDIPDPYYKGLEGFYEVYELLEKSLPLCIDKLAKKEAFSEDIHRLYAEIEYRDREIFGLYDALPDSAFGLLLQDICKRAKLPKNANITHALKDRFIQLKEGPILQELKNLGKNQEEILQIQALLFEEVEKFTQERHQKILDFIEKEELLSGFYRALLVGVDRVGVAMNAFAKAWQKALFAEIYPMLEKSYSQEQIFSNLQKTMEREFDGKKWIFSDRSYSIPKIKKDIPKDRKEHFPDLEILPYASAFEKEGQEVILHLEDLISSLREENDEIYGQKEQYIAYFKALKKAFGTKDRESLIANWQEVDALWMEIKTPIQIGHPFEYYEDKYRHATAPEWDVRLARTQKEDTVSTSLKHCFEFFAQKIDASESLCAFTRSALEKVQSYHAIPALFYGSNYNGLFSAQVVPNDEKITKSYGKKIFAFPDRILEMMRNKPKMQISFETFGKARMQRYYELILHQEKLWYEIYKITTNGHEYGHILWMEEDTQVKMNASGMFKNIEEFKATSGGLCGFFLSNRGEGALFQEVLFDTLMRAVGLIAWREQDEVLPYYYEGLMHLCGGFDSGVLDFDRDRKETRLQIHSQEFPRLREWYLEYYQKLAKHYADKKDAKIYVDFFIEGKDPISRKCREFVQWYWEQYQSMGRELWQGEFLNQGGF